MVPVGAAFAKPSAAAASIVVTAATRRAVLFSTLWLTTLPLAPQPANAVAGLPSPMAAVLSAPAAAEEEEEEEVKYTVPGGLAQLRLELKLAENAAEGGLSSGCLAELLRKPVFLLFIGFDADKVAAGAPANRQFAASAADAIDRVLPILSAFPASSRRRGAEAFGRLLNELRALNELTQVRTLDEPQARALLTSAVASTEELASAYYSNGCMVCPEPVKAASGSPDFENPNNRKLLEYEEYLSKQRLRRPDERDEKLARKLGFREGELIGGY